MAKQGSVTPDHSEVEEGAGFPYLAVIISAIVLLAVGAFFLNLGVGGSLPTGFGVGDTLPESKIAGVDLDLVRGIIIVVILAIIAGGAFMVLRKRS